MGSKGNRFDIEEDMKRNATAELGKILNRTSIIVYNYNWCSGTSLRVLKEPTLKAIK